jgi:hemerythrin-like domain-containing protein
MTPDRNDVVTLIERDHREVEELFAKFASTGDISVAREICDALDRHATGEERAVYPVVAAELPNGKQMAGEGEDEHAEARALVERLRVTEGAAPLAALVAELEMIVEEHVDVEETEVLPQVRAVLDPGRLESLSRDFQSAKRLADQWH